MTDNLEFSIRVTALKKAALVMGGLSKGMKSAEAKAEIESLAWVISWAVNELEKQRKA